MPSSSCAAPTPAAPPRADQRGKANLTIQALVAGHPDVYDARVLTANRRSDNFKMLARDAGRHDAPFACPACLAELILRKGSIRIHHFAHKAPTSCRLGFGETQDHFQVKLAIFDGLRDQPNVTHLELEKRLPGAVADIYAIISGVPVAIEVQRSVLGVEGIAARTLNYHRLGVAVIWVALSKGDLDFERYSPSSWERWCHAANFGRVYYWSHGQVLRPVHFAPFTLHVAHQTWRKHGEEHSAGGYDKRSKLWVRPQAGIPMMLSSHFQKRTREAWSGGKLVIPECTLFVDRQPKWWS